MLGQFDGCLTYYLYEVPTQLGKRFSNPFQIVKHLVFVYKNWSGRMTGYTFMRFGYIFPKFIQAFFTAIIFSANILLTLRIAHEKTYNAFTSPLLFCLLYLVCYWYRLSCYYSYMWTMVCVYSFPVFLILLYYNLTMRCEILEKRHGMLILQLMGFAAGFSHEVLSLALIVAVGTNWLIDLAKKKCVLKDIFRHSSLGVGYILCVLAPGNFHRSKQSHDIVSSTYSERIKSVCHQNIDILTNMKVGSFLIYSLLIISFMVIIIMIVNREDINAFIEKKIGLIAACCTLVVVWAATPKHPLYGEDLWIFLVYAILLSVAVKISEYVCISKWIKILCPILVILLFCAANCKEVYSYSKVSLERRALVKQAVSR